MKNFTIKIFIIYVISIQNCFAGWQLNIVASSDPFYEDDKEAQIVLREREILVKYRCLRGDVDLIIDMLTAPSGRWLTSIAKVKTQGKIYDVKDEDGTGTTYDLTEGELPKTLLKKMLNNGGIAIRIKYYNDTKKDFSYSTADLQEKYKKNAETINLLCGI